MTFDLERLVRSNILDLKPYSSARSEFVGTAEIFLDANENAFGSPAGGELNRYPDPLQTKLKRRIASIKQVRQSQIFVGNGSDEVIDLLFRIFCKPGRDEVIICPPTYGMYRVSADINDAVVREVPLTNDFQLDVPAIRSAISEKTKLIFICSPNNPTGNLMSRESVIGILTIFDGIVVLDEAYIDFAGSPSMTSQIETFRNLVVLQTLSKAWGMAGLRIGLAFADETLIGLLNRVKPPYNVSQLAQDTATAALDNTGTIDSWVAEILSQRERLIRELSRLPAVKRIFSSQANFLLIGTVDADAIYKYLVDNGLVVRNRNNVELCEGCLRITVGTPEENRRVVSGIEQFGTEKI